MQRLFLRQSQIKLMDYPEDSFMGQPNPGIQIVFSHMPRHTLVIDRSFQASTQEPGQPFRSVSLGVKDLLIPDRRNQR